MSNSDNGKFRKNSATTGLVEPPVMETISEGDRIKINRAQTKLRSLLENSSSQHQVSDVVRASFELTQAYRDAFKSVVGNTLADKAEGYALNDLIAMEKSLARRNTSASVETDDTAKRRIANYPTSGLGQ